MLWWVKLGSRHHDCSGSSGSNGSSGSSGSTADPCFTSIETQDDVIDMYLSTQTENEYNSTGNFELGKDMKNQFPPVIRGKDASSCRTTFSTSVLHNYELNLLLKDFKQQEHYLMIDDHPPTWVGVN